VLTDIHVDFRTWPPPRWRPAHLPDLMAHRPLVVYGKLTGRPTGASSSAA
jgi:hypothetical protein